MIRKLLRWAGLGLVNLVDAVRPDEPVAFHAPEPKTPGPWLVADGEILCEGVVAQRLDIGGVKAYLLTVDRLIAPGERAKAFYARYKDTAVLNKLSLARGDERMDFQWAFLMSVECTATATAVTLASRVTFKVHPTPAFAPQLDVYNPVLNSYQSVGDV